MNSVARLEFVKAEYNCIFQLPTFCSNVDIFIGSVKTIPATHEDRSIGLERVKHYECFYALKCITTLNFSFVDQILARGEATDMKNFLLEKSEEDPGVLVEVLFDIYYAIERGAVILNLYSMKALYEKYVAKKREQLKYNEKENGVLTNKICTLSNSIETNIVRVKRAYLFPTHVRFCPPQMSLTNRILKFAKAECFMRVSVRDVDFQNVNYTSGRGGKSQEEFQKAFLDTYVARPLEKGFKLRNRHYKYLGCSTSQLKSHSLWYFTVDPAKKDVTVGYIRKNVGDFKKIPEVPKFMARFGLSFSQAMNRINVPQSCTNVNDPEPDIKGGQKIYLDDSDNECPEKKRTLRRIKDSAHDDSLNSSDDEDEPDPYVFSDGIGRISEVIAEEIYETLELPDNERPCAFQIRYAGCKGMLVVDPTLKGRKIIFRESMKKYDSTDDSLEILKYSKPRNVCLNRHLIAILEHKGIEEKIFLNLQKEMIQTFVKSLFFDGCAWHMLNTYSQLRLNYEALYKSGFSLIEDPFFRTMIFAVFKIQIRLLKEKARIKLPNNKARNMFGILDETKTLKYGEVFVQYTKWNSNKTKTLECAVVVTKNPCMSPGDVRIFKAIDVPELRNRNIKDCIVFPAQGNRPHPDEMAGSDLDGDEYVVIWHEDLIFDKNSSAMNYAIKTANKRKREIPIEISDEIGHFCNYIMNDNTGTLANSYLACADKEGVRRPNGKMNEKCYKIAKKYAMALDFAKTGIPATMDHRLVVSDYPDFFGYKVGKGSYLSQKILGYLFRNCKHLELGLHATLDNTEFKCDDDLEYGSWRNYEKGACIILDQYKKEIFNRLRKYNMRTEGELLSGAIHESQKLYLGSSGIIKAVDELETEMRSLFSAIEKEFFAEFGGKPKDNKFTDEMMCKASSWYMVTYSQNQNPDLLFGLPWAVSDVLIAIKQSRKTEVVPMNSSETSNITYLEKIIDNTLKDKLPKLNLSDANSIQEYKNAVIKISYDVLSHWIKTLHLVICDEQEVESLLEQDFNASVSILRNCDIDYIEKQLQSSSQHQIISPGYYILKTLLKISDKGINNKPSNVYSDSHQELGILTWITLIKLASSSNLLHLGLADENEGSILTLQENIVETITIRLNEKLIPVYINAADTLKAFLIDKSRVIKISLIDEREREKWKLKLTVMGSPFCVERLKYFVSSKKFLDETLNNESIKQALKTAEEETKKLRLSYTETEEKQKPKKKNPSQL